MCGNASACFYNDHSGSVWLQETSLEKVQLLFKSIRNFQQLNAVGVDECNVDEKVHKKDKKEKDDVIGQFNLSKPEIVGSTG